MTKINITKLAAQLDCMMNEWSYFVNKSTGEIFSFDNTYLAYVEEFDEINVFN